LHRLLINPKLSLIYLNKIVFVVKFYKLQTNSSPSSTDQLIYNSKTLHKIWKEQESFSSCRRLYLTAAKSLFRHL